MRDSFISKLGLSDTLDNNFLYFQRSQHPQIAKVNLNNEAVRVP